MSKVKTKTPVKEVAITPPYVVNRDEFANVPTPFYALVYCYISKITQMAKVHKITPAKMTYSFVDGEEKDVKKTIPWIADTVIIFNKDNLHLASAELEKRNSPLIVS